MVLLNPSAAQLTTMCRLTPSALLLPALLAALLPAPLQADLKTLDWARCGVKGHAKRRIVNGKDAEECVWRWQVRWAASDGAGLGIRGLRKQGASTGIATGNKVPYHQQQEATSNKCIASSNKCLTSSNMDATSNKVPYH